MFNIRSAVLAGLEKLAGRSRGAEGGALASRAAAAPRPKGLPPPPWGRGPPAERLRGGERHSVFLTNDKTTELEKGSYVSKQNETREG